MDGDAEDHMDVEEPEETLEDARREYEANEARRQAEAEAEAGECYPSFFLFIFLGLSFSRSLVPLLSNTQTDSSSPSRCPFASRTSRT